MKSVKCDSGMRGWQCKLRENYDDFADFEQYCGEWNLHVRLGYGSAEAAWKANPTVQGSVIPSDFRKVEKRKAKKRRPIRAR
jgi:hypothetical protein